MKPVDDILWFNCPGLAPALLIVACYYKAGEEVVLVAIAVSATPVFSARLRNTFSKRALCLGSLLL